MLFEQTINHYLWHNERSSDYSIHALSNDITKYVFWFYSLLSQEEIIDTLQYILEMHKAWITAAGAREVQWAYVLDEIQSSNWQTVCKIIKDRFDFY